MYIKTNSVEERKQFLKILFALGYKWHGDENQNDVDQIEKLYSFQDWPIIDVNNFESNISGNGNCGTPDYNYIENFLSVMEYVSKFSINTITVENVGDYYAKVSKDGVIINGYTIPLEKIQEIADAVAKFK